MSDNATSKNEELLTETLEANEEKHPQKAISTQSQSKDTRSVASLMEYGFSDLEMDDNTFEELFNKTVSTIREDELVKGKIVNITKDEILVDIGFKSLGVVPRAELLNAETYAIGDEVDVYIENIEDSTGKLVLSRRRADFMRIWDDIIALYEKQEIIKVKILRRIKGGMVVDLLGIEAFLPGSQIDVRPVRDFDNWVTKTIEVKVVKVNHPSENVVVSHKVLLEEQLAEQRYEIMSRLEKGLVLEGTVKAISDFGVFVDLGGIDGLVHITDLSWGRVTHPTEIVELDQVVKVVVLDFDQDKRRISLGMKQLTEHPWDNIGEKYEKNIRVQGKVVSLTDYGAFIEIEKGIEGLIHISEMSWTQHVKHPSQIVSMGQIVDAVVLNIDKDNKKLALGMKQLEPDPWEDLMRKYPVDSHHRGIVRNLTNFGVFIELEPGVDGLIHISDLSWTKKIRHPGEFVKKGDEIDVVVLSIDPEQRRIALGHKQIKDNPWDYFEEKYHIGFETSGVIERIIEKGVIVELPDILDGFVPVSQLSFAPVKNIVEFFKIGDKLPLKVVEFDKESKKIVLSAVEALRGKDQSEIDAYNEAHPVPNSDHISFPTEEELRSEIESYKGADVDWDYPFEKLKSDTDVFQSETTATTETEKSEADVVVEVKAVDETVTEETSNENVEQITDENKVEEETKMSSETQTEDTVQDELKTENVSETTAEVSNEDEVEVPKNEDTQTSDSDETDEEKNQ